MTGRWWQSAMIALARSPRVKAFMQTSRSASFLARKYVAGETPAEGAACARRLLDEEGLRSSLSYLGEYVDTPELVAENVASKIAVARALRAAALDVHISVDPTQIGYHMIRRRWRRRRRGLPRRFAGAALAGAASTA